MGLNENWLRHGEVGSDFGLIVGCSRAMVDLVRWLGEDREVVKEGIR
jgi:hypothetical protein